MLCAFLHLHVGWPSRYFLPEDALHTCLYGPRFLELDNHSLEDLADLMKRRFGVELEPSEIGDMSEADLGTFVDRVAERIRST
jgi:hypothetical protein